MAKILLVEDDAPLAVSLKDCFAAEGHLLEIAATGEDALQLFENFQYEILLLDWSLPGITGLEVCKLYRKSGGLANIIFLTGRGDIAHKEEALYHGADDYITKPFSTRELSARVRSALRRPYSLLPNQLKVNNLILDLKLDTISVGDGTEQHLTGREAALLAFFMKNTNRVYAPKELARLIWPVDSDVTAETVRSSMRNLRAKISAITNDTVIQTISKSGYLLEKSS